MGSLVEARELRENDGSTVLEVRWGPGVPDPLASFRAGHVPGAQRADLDAELAAPPGPRGRHPLPEAAAFSDAMARAGVSADRRVVVYDQRDGTVAARLWWLLRYFGHRDVCVLDGGFEAWERAGFPVDTGDAERPPRGDFVATPGHLPMLTVDEVSDFAGTLLDARAAERYRGEVEPIDPVAGHIPGAVSAPTAGNIDESGRFLTPQQLRTRFAGLGVDDSAPIGAYCGSGVTAAHEVFALQLAGFDAALYPGSWSEWIADPARKIARGTE
jgi:thiosulfate/3-mercaptopyruvate sulfurtransferase